MGQVESGMKIMEKMKRNVGHRAGGARMGVFVACAVALMAFLVPAAAGANDTPPYPLSVLVGAPVSADAAETSISNSTTGASYDTLSDALAAVNEGDTLVLNGDSTQSGALSCDRAFTLDLAGHTLTIEGGSGASAGSDGDGGALALNASGTTMLRDSSGGGALIVNVGAQTENMRTYRSGYQGIYIGNGGSLVVDGCKVQVSYTGSWRVNTGFDFSLTGISAGNASSVDLEGQSSLTVSAAPADGERGATVVRGLCAQSGASQINVGESASVEVDANAKVFTNGSTVYPGYASYSGSDSGTGFLELNLDQGDSEQKAIYDEIQELFKKGAKVDASGDSAGYVSGYNIYYAQGLWLDEEVEVWATSDQMDVVDVGDVSKIKATHFFVQAASVASKQEAYGITAAVDFSGTVTQRGKVDASVVEGDAFAVRESTTGTWNTDEGKLSATADEETYCRRGGSFNLADYVDITPEPTSRVTYPVGSASREVNEVKSATRGIAVQGIDYQELVNNGTAGWKALFPDTPDKVNVTFTGMKDAAGHAANDVSVATDYSSTLAAAGVSAPEVSDYTDGDTTYRFVGWEEQSSSGGSHVFRSDYVNKGMAFDATVSGAASDGASSFSASYVAVSSGQHLVSFYVDGAVYAYAADDGSAPTYLQANTTASSSEPSSLQEVRGYDFDFSGWYEGATDDNSWSRLDSRTVITGSLPEVTGDVVYTALFEKVGARENLYFSYLGSSGSSVSYTNTSYDWTTGQVVNIANSLVQLGDKQVVGGEVYTFLGWAPRQSDTTAMWTTDLPEDYAGSNGFNSSSVAYYAVYSTSTFTATINFYVGDTLYATASDVESNTTIRDAFLASDNPVYPTSDDADRLFLEWNTSADPTGRLYNALTTVGDVDTDASDTVNLYATWEERQHYYTVTFYDSDRKTVLYTVEVLKGDTVENTEGAISAKAKGKIFKYWVTVSGKRFDLNRTRIYKNTKLYAFYRVLNSGSENTSSKVTIPSGRSGATATVNNRIVLPNASTDISGASGGSGSGGGLTKAGKTKMSGRSNSADNSSDSGSSGDSDSSQSSLGNSDVNNTPAVVAGAVLVLVALAALVRWLLGRRAKPEDTDDGVLQLGDMKIRF